MSTGFWRYCLISTLASMCK